jgi:arabinogalactan endo-1,4-beta-galactosidase
MKTSEAHNVAHVSRRRVLKGVGAALGAGLFGSMSETPARADGTSGFINGADVGWLQQMEANGFIFKNAGGLQQDCLTILKGYGVSAIRLRTWVNPSDDPSNGHCSQPETIAMAVRCQNAGLAVMIDFHFGDIWNDAGHQNPPAAWANLSYGDTLSALQRYVSGFMQAMQAAGVAPSWVQIGNEINSGILHPVGSLSKPAQMTGLLNTAFAALKEVFPATLVLIHLAQPQNLTSVQNFFNAYVANGGNWDITAFSSYGSGASTIAGIISNMALVNSQYGRPIMQVEFGGRFDRASRTKTDMASYITGLKNIGALGLFYWEPEVYAPFNTYGSGAWDPTTQQPTIALNSFLLGAPCAPVDMVKASFGKSTGQLGFIPAADLNGDGIVNIQDLALAAQALPPGTTCQ